MTRLPSLARVVVVVALAIAPLIPANASVWDAASASDADRAADAVFELALRAGDEHVLIANTAGSAISERKRQLKNALDAWTRAATAKPASPEPYFRIAEALTSFYLETCGNASVGIPQSPLRDCDAGMDVIDRRVAMQVLAAYAEAEQIAPLDPRFGAGEGGVLFERALVNTRLATQAGYAAAATDYEQYIRRAETKSTDGLANAWSNLAETYMMLGRLDDSIDAYRESASIGFPDVATWYGMAVALDRAGRTSEALDVVRAQGKDGLQHFESRVARGFTFFVPRGEVFYYFALAEEAYGELEYAKAHWEMFIQSGAHPQYHPSAKAHIQALTGKRNASRVDPEPRGRRK